MVDLIKNDAAIHVLLWISQDREKEGRETMSAPPHITRKG